MKIITLDIETKSDKDLAKCGVYAYVESEYFDILLLAYSIDGGDVIVIDIACGEKIPADILTALTDESIIKQAFNVNFERICLSAYIRKHYPKYFKGYGDADDTVGDYLNPRNWQCTMIHSRYLGLPSSLAQVGEVLKIKDEKMSEGKALIRYFCLSFDGIKGVPQFHQPMESPAKWKLFKTYNKRDVEAEMEIDRKLEKFSVPDFVWEEFYIDQKINDRGIAVDMTLALSAIQIDEITSEKLRQDMCRLTGVENPNSVYQLLDWLETQGYKSDSLGKKEVQELIKTAGEPVRSVLAMRLQLSKSSVKKYQAMQNATCSDGRARGMFSYYGASRTGRWCLTGDHEVLTNKGWCRLDKWNGGTIACWSPYGSNISFQKANSLCFSYSGEMYEYIDKRICQKSTPDHKMYVKKRYDKEWTDDIVENMSKYRPSIPFTGFRQITPGMEHSKLRILVMIQADGHFTSDGCIRLAFKKIRKVERCKRLLRAENIMFTYRIYGDRHVFVISSREVPLWLRTFKNKTFDTWLWDESADVFFDELVYWDGYQSATNSIQYVTCNKQNADIIQAFAHLSGRAAQMRIKSRKNEHPNWNDAYVLDIWLTPKNCHEIKNKPEVTYFDGKVYCAETKTGYFLVRRNNKVWITGNSGRNIQLQNLPQNHLPDLSEARGLVKTGDVEMVSLLYDDIPDTLSQLIRTAFVPRKGYKFIVSDYSAIEARVIAWLADEKWRMDAFAKGEDIYCASASKMFGVPVEKHGINGHLRQKGKVAELACGYGGSVGAMKAMGADSLGLSDAELKSIVDDWRASSPSITDLWWAVDSAVKKAIKTRGQTETHGLIFTYQSGFLFIALPSGRRLAYVKPRIGENQFGGESVVYRGLNQQKKWDLLESYGPKFVENIVQAIARDILCYAMQTLSECFIVGHVHDELIIECPQDVTVKQISDAMAKTPPWADGLLLRAEGYECQFYQKD